MTTGLKGVKTISKLHSDCQSPRQEGFWFLSLKWLLISAIVLISLELISKPLRYAWADDLAKKGDAYLLEKRYLEAQLQYEKGLAIASQNKRCLTQLELAKKAEHNILALENFYLENKIEPKTRLFEKAKAEPADIIQALNTVKELIEIKEYELAIIPAQKAVAKDPSFRDAWLYLGIANLNTVKFADIRPEIREKYQEEAKEALGKALSLDDKYQPTLDFIQELEVVSGK